MFGRILGRGDGGGGEPEPYRVLLGDESKEVEFNKERSVLH